MPELTIDVTLTVDTALSVGAGGSAGVLASKAIVRNQLGQLVLPGSHLKGRLRHACEILARAAGQPVCDAPRPETMCPQLEHRTIDPVPAPCPVCRVFGSSTSTGPVDFADLTYAEPGGADAARPPAIRPGASINRRRRTVEDQRLFFTETSPPGGLVTFHNGQAIHGWFGGEDASQRAFDALQLLLAGLRYVQNWGGGKSRGLGWGHIACQARLDGERVTLSDVPASIARLGVNRA